MNICTIHQPNFLPYLGFFEKVSNADILILYDNTQFKKNDFQNRNRIRTKEGWIWLTVPVSYSFGDLISEVKINNSQDWRDKHWKSILNSYSKSKYFLEYKDIFEKIYSQNWNKLVDFNVALIKAVLFILNIDVKVVLASDLGKLESKSSSALIELCSKVNANKYISGCDGKNYLDLIKFKENNIDVEFQEYLHPIYTQMYTGFEKYMSIIDLIFNYGNESKKILLNQ